MSAIIACHRSGVVFDYDAVLPTPYKFVPGSSRPLDQDGVDFYFPAPSPNDPYFASKAEARAEAQSDADRYKSAADAARR